MRIIIPFFHLLSLALLLITNNISAQSSLYEISLEQQITKADLVIEAKVLSKQSFWDDNHHNIYTINVLEVSKSFKGKSPQVVSLVTKGGTVDQKAEIVSPSLELSIGDIGLFTLQINTIPLSSVTEQNLYLPYSSVQGFYEYNLYNNTAVNPFTITEGISQQFYDRVMSQTQTAFKVITPYNVDEKMAAINLSRSPNDIGIASFSPTTISAGTKSILTILGSGFGDEKGDIEFADAQDGGSTYYDTFKSQITSWSDSEITVEVPTRAGTGTFIVRNVDGEMAETTVPLGITFSVLNIEDYSFVIPFAYPTQHVDANGAGGYQWQFNNIFNAVSDATDSFKRALETWQCETNMNWTIGEETTTVNEAIEDGINIVRYEVGNELPDGVLGICASRFDACLFYDYHVSELDITFDNLTIWEFGPNLPSSVERDFETVALHELGHGRQLAHIIDNEDLMNFGLSSNTTIRTLSQKNIDASAYIQNRSTTLEPCGEPSMQDYVCGDPISTNEVEDANITVFPNPVEDVLNIQFEGAENIKQVSFFDCLGNLMLSTNRFKQNKSIELNIDEWISGIYFVQIKIENEVFVRKIIVK